MDNTVLTSFVDRFAVSHDTALSSWLVFSVLSDVDVLTGAIDFEVVTFVTVGENILI